MWESNRKTIVCNFVKNEILFKNSELFTAVSHYSLFYMHYYLTIFSPISQSESEKWFWKFFLKINFSNNFGQKGVGKGSLTQSKTWKYLGLICRNKSNYMEIF